MEVPLWVNKDVAGLKLESVLILLIMEVPLWACATDCHKMVILPVLILLIMEVPLWEFYVSSTTSMVRIVLILLIMEVPLWGVKNAVQRIV